jgi:hypothetical protein
MRHRSQADDLLPAQPVEAGTMPPVEHADPPHRLRAVTPPSSPRANTPRAKTPQPLAPQPPAPRSNSLGPMRIDSRPMIVEPDEAVESVVSDTPLRTTDPAPERGPLHHKEPAPQARPTPLPQAWAAEPAAALPPRRIQPTSAVPPAIRVSIGRVEVRAASAPAAATAPVAAPAPASAGLSLHAYLQRARGGRS